ncbi:MAG: hypothetical protein JSV21_07750 [Nitrospirota bacterium]|nr:MAG: hypothetical protein JSV21_07750 [Nitrospirota bacterium]
MKKKKKRKKGPRLPIEAVLKTGSKPHTTKKGKKGYVRKDLKAQLKALMNENDI